MYTKDNDGLFCDDFDFRVSFVFGDPTPPEWYERPLTQKRTFVKGSVSLIAGLYIPIVGYPPSVLDVSGVPSGMSFDRSQSAVSGKPDKVGTGTLVLTATNSVGTAERRIPWEVVEAK